MMIDTSIAIIGTVAWGIIMFVLGLVLGYRFTVNKCLTMLDEINVDATTKLEALRKTK